MKDPPTTPGATRAVWPLTGTPSIAAFAGGDLAAAYGSRAPGSDVWTTRVARLAPDGKERWSSGEIPDLFPQRVATGGGDVVVVGAPSSVYASPRVVVRISADGAFLETLHECIECRVEVVAADAAGNVLVVARGERGDAQFIATPGGTKHPIAPDLVIVTGGLDGHGSAVLVGRAAGATTLTATKVPLEGDHAPSWSVPLPEEVVPNAIGFSAKGTVVLTASAKGPFARVTGTWGEEPVPVGVHFLLTIESDGRPRWIRPLPSVDLSPVVGPWKLAVLPSGKAFVAASTMGFFHAQLWNLAGDRLWTHTPSSPSRGLSSWGFHALAVGEEQATLAFQYTGTYDFGTGPLHSDRSSAVLVELVP